jgi:NADH-quinone oxidoreductase subunit J
MLKKSGHSLQLQLYKLPNVFHLTMPSPIFWFFALVMLFGAAAVVLLPNPVASAMSMVASFIGLAGLFVGLNAYFAGIIQILVYTGAVMVLFVFIIMLLDLNSDKKHTPKLAPMFAGLGIVIAFTIQLIGVISATPGKQLPTLELPSAAEHFMNEVPASEMLGETKKIPTQISKSLSSNTLPDVHLIGQSLFTQYNLPLQILGALLLVSTVGVVVLSKKQIH